LGCHAWDVFFAAVFAWKISSIPAKIELVPKGINHTAKISVERGSQSWECGSK
jgi:hypothetical protein